TSGTWPGARTAAGWCRTAPPAGPDHPTTETSSPCGSPETWSRSSPTGRSRRRRPMSDPYASRPAVHERTVDGCATVRALPLDPAADAPLLHHWVSEERAVCWGMNGLTVERVAEIYARMETLDTHHAYLVVKDGDPTALLQTYEPEADRVG